MAMLRYDLVNFRNVSVLLYLINYRPANYYHVTTNQQDPNIEIILDMIGGI